MQSRALRQLLLNPNPYGATLDLDFVRGRYWKAHGAGPAGQLYPVPQNVPGWAFTRASQELAQTAGGVYLPFASGVPAITDAGLAVWEARTNFALQSQTLSASPWRAGAGGAAAVATANTTTAPDGTLTADTITSGTVTYGGIWRQSVSLTSGTQYAFSAYVKRANYDYVGLRLGASYGAPGETYHAINLNTGAVIANPTPTGGTVQSFTATPVGGGWYRLVLIYTAAATGSVVLDIAMTNATGVSGWTPVGTEAVYVWQGQLEPGAFATPGIVTAGTAVTRAAGNVSFAVPAAASQGTVIVEGVWPAATVANAIWLEGAGISGVTLGADAAGTRARLLLRHGSNRFDSGEGAPGGAPAMTAGAPFKMALAWDAGGAVAAVAGLPLTSQGVPAQADWGATASIGSRAGTSLHVNSRCQSVIWLPYKATQAELNSRTTA